jgi:hypothetical protein
VFCVAPVAPLLHANVAFSEAVTVAAPSFPRQPACCVCVAEAVKLLFCKIINDVVAVHPLVEVAVTEYAPDAKILLEFPTKPLLQTKVAGKFVVKFTVPFGVPQVAAVELLTKSDKLFCCKIVIIVVSAQPPVVFPMMVKMPAARLFTVALAPTVAPSAFFQTNVAATFDVAVAEPFALEQSVGLFELAEIAKLFVCEIVKTAMPEHPLAVVAVMV